MLRYALYARKSKDDKSGIIKSIQDQLNIWREIAPERGIQIVKEYEENKSAKTPGDRPVYKALMADLRSGAVDGILVWHVNRLARNMEEAGALAQMLIEGRIKEIRTPHWTYKPGDNILPLLLEQGMSTQYSLDLSEAVKRGTDSMVADGGWPHQAKVGYLNRRDPLNPKRGIIVKDPERFDLMRRGFDLMFTGAYTVRQVVDLMNEQWGFRTKPSPSRPGGPLSYAAAYDIFQNPFYAGFTVHNGVQRQGRHEPMITASEYSRLQQVLKAKGQSRRRKWEFTFTGLIRCGYCGMQVTAEGRFKSGKHRVYYHCSDPYGRCTKRGINEERLEAEIVRQLDNITVEPALCEIALENISRWLGEEGESQGEVLKQQHRALEEVERQRNNLLDLMVRGLLTDEAIYREKEQRLLREQSRLQVEIQASVEEGEQIRARARAGFSFVQRAREGFMLGEGQRKKEIARALGVEYVLRGNELTIALDPLLIEIVKFVDEMIAKLEPGPDGSQSQEQAFFNASSCDGRGKRAQFETWKTLLIELRESKFADLFVSPVFQA